MMATLMVMAEKERLRCASAQEWEAWLEANHATCAGVWLQFGKKGQGRATVTYAEAVELALRFGWIDGQARGLDAAYYLQSFTPRRPKSLWSQINRAKAEKLIADGRMRPAGQAAIDRAKADGRWEAAYPSVKTATVPADLQKALAKNPAAKKFFATLNSQNRYAILFRLHTAKKPETRAAKIVKFVAMLAAGERLHA
jgi:uncharacterized protein YdeI (YjbR/CyaY-like superfamily)